MVSDQHSEFFASWWYPGSAIYLAHRRLFDGKCSQSRDRADGSAVTDVVSASMGWCSR